MVAVAAVAVTVICRRAVTAWALVALAQLI